MNETPSTLSSRREFIKKTGKIAAASALAGVAIPHVHAAENNTIQKGLNVFMEKPVTVDGQTSRRMFKHSEEAQKKILKVVVGLMSRHSQAFQELYKRIQDGEIGDIVLLRGYPMHGPVGSAFSE